MEGMILFIAVVVILFLYGSNSWTLDTLLLLGVITWVLLTHPDWKREHRQ